eukprot:CAMPEP_0174715290 /NCGR_PEP_ID=MMETSP1094-20130205/21136_1 /TAXON_ID=156173 /ORGANISM="Chrysochromulina brevifilum, Strain UTEX LB 985" /LENGTH=138 /DNA_ID=CAMNT_0015914843 /DNA_START=609 /DNA_END=1022 /DNA_ORIENTATION=-
MARAPLEPVPSRISLHPAEPLGLLLSLGREKFPVQSTALVTPELLPLRKEPCAIAHAARVEQEIEVAHRKKRARMPDFTSDQERRAFTVESEVALLVPLLPYSARIEMLGGKLGMSQVPSKAAQDNFIHRLLKSRAGT